LRGYLGSRDGVHLLSVAGLESYANEVFVDRHKHFPRQAEDFLRMLWSTFKEKSVLEKFDLALLLRGNSPLEKGTEPVQSVQALVRRGLGTP
jgi:hypothetical protein